MRVGCRNLRCGDLLRGSGRSPHTGPAGGEIPARYCRFRAVPFRCRGRHGRRRLAALWTLLFCLALLPQALLPVQAEETVRVPASAQAAVATARAELTAALDAEQEQEPVLAAIRDLTGMLQAAQTRQAEIDAELAMGDLFALRQEEADLTRRVQDGVRHLYTSGWSTLSYWVNLLGARSLTELSARGVYLEKIIAGDAERLAAVQQQADQITLRSADVGALQAERAALTEQITALSQDLRQQEEARRSYLLGLKLPPETLAAIALEPRTASAIRALAAAAAVPGKAPQLSVPVSGEVARYATEADPGVDIKASLGEAVTAPAAGEVIFAGWASDLGNAVMIAHRGGLVTLLATLGTVEVEPGETVQAGERIGQVGMTGWSLAPHLRLETWLNGAPVNPLTHF